MDDIIAQTDRIADEETQTRSKDGVDLTLIRWMLSLTPKERLLVLQQNIRSIMRLRSERRIH
jgi:hypothetical protein